MHLAHQSTLARAAAAVGYTAKADGVPKFPCAGTSDPTAKNGNPDHSSVAEEQRGLHFEVDFAQIYILGLGIVCSSMKGMDDVHRNTSKGRLAEDMA